MDHKVSGRKKNISIRVLSALLVIVCKLLFVYFQMQSSSSAGDDCNICAAAPVLSERGRLTALLDVHELYKGADMCLTGLLHVSWL